MQEEISVEYIFSCHPGRPRRFVHFETANDVDMCAAAATDAARGRYRIQRRQERGAVRKREERDEQTDGRTGDKESTTERTDDATTANGRTSGELN